jgi:hypothetical protein
VRKPTLAARLIGIGLLGHIRSDGRGARCFRGVGGLFEAEAPAFEAGLGEIAQGVEDTGVGAGLGRDLIFEDNWIEVGEQGKHLGYSDVKAGGIKARTVFLLNDVGGEVEAEAHLFEAGPVLEPVLVTAGVPARNVVSIEVMSALSEFFNDGGVGQAIEEHTVNEIAKFPGKASDLAGAAVMGLGVHVLDYCRQRGRRGLRSCRAPLGRLIIKGSYEKLD